MSNISPFFLVEFDPRWTWMELESIAPQGIVIERRSMYTAQPADIMKKYIECLRVGNWSRQKKIKACSR